MNRFKRNYLENKKPEPAKQRELQALAELIRMNDVLKKRNGVYRRDLISEVRNEREQDNERVWRGDV